MRFTLVASILLVTAASACSRAESAPARTPAQPAVTAAAAHAPAGERLRLVFFMNPNGMPCQVQDQILRGMGDLPSRADLVYLRTTNPNDLPLFDRFGIRSLPALVVIDGSGREVRRGTPGIQSEAQVRALLGL